jgi:exonuclease III
MRIVTWNLHGSARPDITEVVDYLSRLEADVICFQEIQKRQGQRIAAGLDMNIVWSFKHWPIFYAQEGLAIASKSPIDKNFTFILRNAPFFSFKRRIAQVATVNGLRIVNTHFSSGEPEQHAHQVHEVIHVYPDLIAGDLNMWPTNKLHAEFRTAGFADATLNSNSPPWVAEHHRIDYVYARKQLSAKTIATATLEVDWELLRRLSDHIPLIIDVER